MIQRAFITQWGAVVPWTSPRLVEQDLIICRALVSIYNEPFLSEHLAFRGGTALHKLYLHPQPRYSEDIDLVQVNAEPIKETIDHLLPLSGHPSRLRFSAGSLSVKRPNVGLKLFPTGFFTSGTLILQESVYTKQNSKEDWVIGYPSSSLKILNPGFNEAGTRHCTQSR